MTNRFFSQALKTPSGGVGVATYISGLHNHQNEELCSFLRRVEEKAQSCLVAYFKINKMMGGVKGSVRDNWVQTSD